MNETGQDSSDSKKPLESWKTAGIIVATATLMIGVVSMGTFLNLKEQNRLMTEESATFSPCKIEEKLTSPMGRAGHHIGFIQVVGFSKPVESYIGALKSARPIAWRLITRH